MRSARDELGARRFQPEVLTGEQIAGFFSRVATKKKLAPSRVNRGESDDEVLGEDNRAADRGGGGPLEICVYVMREVSLQHPIVSSSGYNICELMRARKKKSTSLSVDMLRSICTELSVDVCDMTQRRKSPYISRLSQLVDECNCGS